MSKLTEIVLASVLVMGIAGCASPTYAADAGKGPAKKESSEKTKEEKELEKRVKEAEQLVKTKKHEKAADIYWDLDMYKEASGQFKLAIDGFDEKRDKKEKAGLYFKLGFSHGELKQWGKGLDAYKNGMKLKPEIKTSSPPYKSKEAEKLVDQGIRIRKTDLRKAVENMQKAEKLEPTNPRINYEAGWAYLFNKKGKEAIVEFKKAMKKDPFYASPFGGIGKHHYSTKNIDECVFAYSVFIIMDPTNKYKSTFEKRITEMKGLLKK